MPFPSPPVAYVLGAGSILIGLHCFLRPREEYGRFGLPLEPAPRHQKDGTTPTDTAGRASPLMHLKGIREITYGLALGTLQYLGQEDALTAMVGIVSLAGLGDGIIVWLNSGPELRHKAFGHWGAFVALAGWSWWRATSQMVSAADTHG
ncbi:hypothetical protein F4820DRAFT_241073 [Hypoxylon rubiginosum]|uniref:Uncharacterized protein n=1 Tax=Hypoxylon rubiginosum TaxID=110542 RepID=A0ACB9Z661_9PEZI|nr:hypothetical protein F4820DRAFT_241073 [Hypoxylon rubiginosum]